MRIEPPGIPQKQIQTYMKELKNLNEGERASEIRKEIQSLTSQFASIVRTEKGLKEGLIILKFLKKKGIAQDEKGLIFALETKNLMEVAEMIFRACLLRKESRGPHLFFERFDDLKPVSSKDPEWRKYIVLRKEGEKMILMKRAPVPLSF